MPYIVARVPWSAPRCRVRSLGAVGHCTQALSPYPTGQAPQLEAMHNKDNGIIHVTGNFFTSINFSLLLNRKPVKIIVIKHQPRKLTWMKGQFKCQPLQWWHRGLQCHWQCSILTPASCVLQSHHFAPFQSLFTQTTFTTSAFINISTPRLPPCYVYHRWFMHVWAWKCQWAQTIESANTTQL